MLKKLFLIFCTFVVTAGIAAAYSIPRWSVFPLTVYIDPASGSSNVQIAQKAFNTWQGAARPTLKFFIKNSPAFKKTANIYVTFTDELGGKYYSVEPVFSNAYYVQFGSTGFYLHIDLKISKTGPDGKALSADKLYSVALQAVGRAMGAGCIAETGNVMSCSTDFSKTTLTNDDINLLKDVYRITKIKH